ncbi:hypothetical protein LK411_05480 [Tsukamurella paurometabola]|nr:hypothetical protein [Tsukamurella paurometabola]UEA84279.1 hypothetical protein LK411_05480 [Tsukamurella paurometabola]
MMIRRVVGAVVALIAINSVAGCDSSATPVQTPSPSGGTHEPWSAINAWRESSPLTRDKIKSRANIDLQSTETPNRYETVGSFAIGGGMTAQRVSLVEIPGQSFAHFEVTTQKCEDLNSARSYYPKIELFSSSPAGAPNAAKYYTTGDDSGWKTLLSFSGDGGCLVGFRLGETVI